MGEYEKNGEFLTNTETMNVGTKVEPDQMFQSSTTLKFVDLCCVGRCIDDFSGDE